MKRPTKKASKSPGGERPKLGQKRGKNHKGGKRKRAKRIPKPGGMIAT